MTMTRTEIAELLQKMEQFADFLFAQGLNASGNDLMGFVETIDIVLEDVELSD